ncbi:MAG: PglZ domain-containing protein [Adlercreutzia equolifaciens]
MLIEAAERVQDELNLEMRLAKAPLSAIVASDIFPATGRVIVRDLAASLAQGADRRAELREAAGVRGGLAGYDDVACYSDALEAACAMQDFLRAHGEGFHEAPAAAVWEAYTTDWWRMDAAYRRFCEAFERCARDADPDLADALGPLADWAEGQRQRVRRAGQRVLGCYCRDRLGADGLCRGRAAPAAILRRGGGKRARRSQARGGHRSDALRYEVARELAGELERGQRVECRVDAVQEPSSMTRFGMAALPPHRAMGVDADGNGAVLVDGLPTVTTEQRQAVLRARRPKSVALRAEKVLAMKSAEQKELARDAEVVYVYHNTVDATGEDASTEHDVFGACERAVRDICGLVRVATNQIKAARIVVTADHGFLYTRCPRPPPTSSRAERWPLRPRETGGALSGGAPGHRGRPSGEDVHGGRGRRRACGVGAPGFRAHQPARGREPLRPRRHQPAGAVRACGARALWRLTLQAHHRCRCGRGETVGYESPHHLHVVPRAVVPARACGRQWRRPPTSYRWSMARAIR